MTSGTIANIKNGIELKLYDEIYDKDAVIHGVVIGLNPDRYSVLWDNEVIGSVSYDDPAIELTGKNFETVVHNALLGRESKKA